MLLLLIGWNCCWSCIIGYCLSGVSPAPNGGTINAKRKRSNRAPLYFGLVWPRPLQYRPIVSTEGETETQVTSRWPLDWLCPQCFPSLKKLQLPSLSKLPFKSIDQKFLDKSRTQLNAFLQVALQPRCCLRGGLSRRLHLLPYVYPSLICMWVCGLHLLYMNISVAARSAESFNSTQLKRTSFNLIQLSSIQFTFIQFSSLNSIQLNCC